MPNDLLIYELFGLQDLVDDGTLVPLGGNVYQFTRDHLHDPVIQPKPTLRPNWVLHLGDTWKASQGAVIHILGLSGTAPTVQRPGQQAFTFQFDIAGAYAAYTGGVRFTGDNAPVEPIIEAGPNQTVLTGSRVTLVAKLKNRHNFQRMPFNWIQTEGPVVTLSDIRSLEPTFTAPVVTSLTKLTFKIITTDGSETFSDDVSVFVDV